MSVLGLSTPLEEYVENALAQPEKPFKTVKLFLLQGNGFTLALLEGNGRNRKTNKVGGLFAADCESERNPFYDSNEISCCCELFRG
jgi:hypothetical protein